MRFLLEIQFLSYILRNMYLHKDPQSSEESVQYLFNYNVDIKYYKKCRKFNVYDSII